MSSTIRKTMTALALMATLPAATPAIAAELVTFEAGTPARAEDVNANFEALDTELSNIELTPGPQGPAGPQGATGAQGPAGATGARGPAGPQGIAGPQGPAGPAGAEGPQGPAGPAGAEGPEGPAGPAGAEGAQGPQGLAGADGADGAIGPEGPRGPAGQDADPQRLEDLETAVAASTATSFGPEWFLASSTSGQLSQRNVIVLRGDRGGDQTQDGACSEHVYRVLVHFENTEALIVQNASGSATPEEIFLFGFLCADRENPTVINYASEYVYALPTRGSTNDPRAAYSQAYGVEINEDFNGDGSLTNNQNAFDYTLTMARNPLAASELMQQVEMYRDGNENLTVNDFSSLMTRFEGSLTIGGPLNETFDDVAMATFSGYSGGGAPSIRFQANGIGLVQVISEAGADDAVYSSQLRQDAIFYRVDGVTNGSLVDTPFMGGNAQGVWFMQ